MPEPTYDALDIPLQLAAAYGQGAGSLLFETGALRPAYDAYAPHIDRELPHWDEDALGSISIMRAMGAYAAHLAMADRRFVISRGDVETAMTVVTRSHARPLGHCRISLR